MKKYHFLIIITLTFFIGFLVLPYLPWWGIALITFLLAIIFEQSNTKQFFAGFLSAAFLWGVFALNQSLANEGIIANRIGGLLGGLPGVLIILITALIGGFSGGLGALTGSLARKLFG